METSIPIIDIFAGPGGLGEGFSALKSANGEPIFKIKLSIEKDAIAHQTLELRAFYRQFSVGNVPVEYYQYLQGETKMDRVKLFRKYPKEAQAAQKEAWEMELEEKNRGAVKKRIDEVLVGISDWVLIGGPPCQAYSLAGRSRMIGKDEKTKENYEKDPRHFLYKEYLHILAEHQPAVFVMENVKGLLSSKIQQQKTFELILSDLENPTSAIRSKSEKPITYKLFSVSKKRSANSGKVKPEDFIVRSEDYGIPQARHRIIILGIRSDRYKSDPDILDKLTKQISIDDVIGDLPKLRSKLSKEDDSAPNWRDAIKSMANSKWLKAKKSSIKLAIMSAMKKVGANLDTGSSFVSQIVTTKKYNDWYVDNALAGVCNHETRGHIREDLHRYFFSAVFARKNKRSPKLSNFPKALLPKHGNVKKRVGDTIFNDRFRVQIKGRPSTTIVSYISKDGHYYIHYDPSQCRSLTVREAARLQTFRDNYYFEGNRTQQYHQVGNAVPPMLAHKIAAIVYKVLQDPIG
jgi:DNA (cytosine-5)-methyltransferase 1